MYNVYTSLLAVAFFFLITFFNLILDAPRIYVSQVVDIHNVQIVQKYASAILKYVYGTV
jgi:hypothetical protein